MSPPAPRPSASDPDKERDKDTVNSLHRQWQILSHLPSGKWIGTRDIQEKLQLEGIQISLRTIQRDLNQIAERFPIENNGAMPQGWRWKNDAPIQSLPHMNSSQAVIFMMVEEHLKHLLPPTFLSEIRPWFDMARSSLSSQHNGIRQWVDRVRIIPPTQPLIPPAVNHLAQTAIYEALLQDRQLACVYSSRSNAKSHKSYVLNPLALVQRGITIYLLCTRADSSDIQTFVLHRFRSAEVLESRAIHPVDFDLDDYIESGQLGFRIDVNQPTEQVDLQLTLRASDATTFFESRLSLNQRIEELGEGMIRVHATIPMTSQLVWWLRGFGKKIQHIEPTQLAALVWETDQPHPSRDP